jgi:hypothetical protein
MPASHECQRQACGCESHRSIEHLPDGSVALPTQRQWQVACQAHGGWLPTTLPVPPPNELQQQLHLLREQEQALIDQLENLQEQIARLETRLGGESARKRGRTEI